MLELATVIKEEFAPLFRSLGFKGSGSHYRRCRESFIDCIKIQRSKDGCSFCINLGVHPIFALKDKTEEKNFKEFSCWFRWRLRAAGQEDQWWSTETLYAAEVFSVQIQFKNRGLQYFERFPSLEAVLDVTPCYIVRESEEIEKLGWSTLQFPFFAAQANKFMGNTANARALAEFALSV